jgi:hypothetical protein
MLPNDYHPGQRCSCGECQNNWREAMGDNGFSEFAKATFLPTFGNQIHYGPVWYKREVAGEYSFAACEIRAPAVLSTHKPWVNCEACKQTKEFRSGCESSGHQWLRPDNGVIECAGCGATRPHYGE